MSKKIWIAIVLGIIVLVVAASVYQKSRKPIHVDVAQASRRTIEEIISASGIVEPANSVELAADVSGEVTAVKCKQGQSVAQGDLLMQIRPDIYKSMVDRARSSSDAQRFAIAQTKSQLNQAEARLRKAQLDYNQNNTLFKQQVISAAENEVFKTNLEIVQKEVSSVKEAVNGAQANYSGSLANLRESVENLRKTNIYAPVSGTITSLKIKTGERVVGTNQMAGTVLLTIAGTGGMDAIVNINENDILKIRKDNQARVYVDAEPDTYFEGKIYEIADVANAKATADAVTEYKVKIRLGASNKGGISATVLKSGLTTNVEIVIASKQNVLAVPISAVQYQKTASTGKDSTMKPYVYLYTHSEKAVKKQFVKAGLSSYEFVEMEGNSVKPMHNVVTGPYSFFTTPMKPGQKIDTTSESK